MLSRLRSQLLLIPLWLWLVLGTACLAQACLMPLKAARIQRMIDDLSERVLPPDDQEFIDGMRNSLRDQLDVVHQTMRTALVMSAAFFAASCFKWRAS